jgi:hypothetical protein
MQRPLSIAVFVISMLLASIVSTGIACLPDLSMPDLDYPAFEQGALLQLFLTRTLWSKYPSIFPYPVICHLYTPILLIIYSGIYYLCCFKRRTRPLFIWLICLAIGLVPYLAGKYVLSTSPDFKTIAYWTAAMFAGLLFAAMACAVFSAIDIRRHPPIMAPQTPQPVPKPL